MELRIASRLSWRLAEKLCRRWFSTGLQELLRVRNKGKVHSRRVRAREPVTRFATRLHEQRERRKAGARTPR